MGKKAHHQVIIRKMQIKTTMNYHLTSIETAIIKDKRYVVRYKRELYTLAENAN